jgi:3-oxoacyl-[acyl-carrier protein] reductase
MNNEALLGKTALVCGSTQGIGAASALALAGMGARTVLMARNKMALNTMRNLCHALNPINHEIIVADFSDADSLTSIISNYISSGNTVDILVNNTGGPPAGLLIDADYSEILKAMTQHLQCSHILTKAVVAGMKQKGFGRIINVISTSVKIPLPGLGVSNTVRGAMGNWSKTLAYELGGFGITVNNVLPGFTKTARLESIIQQKAAKSSKTTQEVEQEMLKEVPAGRFAAPEEVAHAVAFLASSGSGYINGINIPVDGGRTGCL